MLSVKTSKWQEKFDETRVLPILHHHFPCCPLLFPLLPVILPSLSPVSSFSPYPFPLSLLARCYFHLQVGYVHILVRFVHILLENVHILVRNESCLAFMEGVVLPVWKIYIPKGEGGNND